jgi:hypothetical protein
LEEAQRPLHQWVNDLAARLGVSVFVQLAGPVPSKGGNISLFQYVPAFLGCESRDWRKVLKADQEHPKVLKSTKS